MDIGNILIYQTEKGDTKVDAYFSDDSIWMTQKSIAELYNTSPQNITLHIKNIYSEGELLEEATCKNYLQVASSIDYDPHSALANNFFKTVQNKLHYSVHGHTAPELIHERADATKDNMGLTSFKGVKVRKSDVTIAKNYLNKDEIDNLNRIVTMYLDYAEDHAKQHIPMYMHDWEDRLNGFLQFMGRKVLDNNGHITREEADRFAIEQYELFDRHRKAVEAHSDDFDALPILPEHKN